MRNYPFKVFCLFCATVFYSACTVNFNSAPNTNSGASAVSNNTPAVQAAVPQENTRWSVILCTSRDATVTLAAGAGESDSQTFATWRQGETQRAFALPERLQNLSSIYFEANGSDVNPVELCVLYNRRPKKRVSFDEGKESHIVNAGDDDDNDCRCTE